MVRLMAVGVTVLAIASANTRWAVADENASAPAATLEGKKAFLLAAISTDREKLTAADFHVKGTIVDERWTKPHRVSLHAVVDLASGGRRFDMRAPISFDDNVAEPTTIRRIVLNQSDATTYLVSPPAGMGELILVRPEEKAPFEEDFWSFDVRAIGLQAGMVWARPNNDLKSCLAGLEKAELLACDESSADGIVKTEWLARINSPGYEKIGQLCRLWLDRNRHYVPVRNEVIMCSLGEADGYQEIPNSPRTSVELTWAENGSLILPAVVKASDGRRVTDLAFEWKKVNTTIPEVAFTREGLGLPGSTLVVDERLGRSVLLGRLDGEPIGVTEPYKPPQGPREWRLFWLVVNATVAAILSTPAE